MPHLSGSGRDSVRGCEDGEANEIGTIGCVQALEDASEVVADTVRRKPEGGGDLWIGLSRCYMFDDLPLSRRESLIDAGEPGRGRSHGDPVEQLMHGVSRCDEGHELSDACENAL